MVSQRRHVWVQMYLFYFRRGATRPVLLILINTQSIVTVTDCKVVLDKGICHIRNVVR